MNTDRRKLLIASAGSLLLSLAPWEIARGAKMVAVRMWPAEEYTRVTLEHDSPLQFKYFFVRSSHPLRLVVDIKGLELTESLKQKIAAVQPNDPYIASMRIAQFLPDTVRLVMDLKKDVKPEVFLLKPFGKFKYRLVFDIYPVKPTDEIGRLLAETTDTSTDAKTDPLAEIINKLNRPGKTEPATEIVKNKPKQNDSSKPVTKAPVKHETLLVVVDPGHGGEDSGAVGRRGTKEKDVVLKISRRLVALINKEPGMKAIMTRNSDHFVSLGGRVRIARRARAHLLISIHADAWTKPSVRGSGVFALSERGATSADARWLAKKQNESDLIGGVNIGSVDRTLANVLVNMASSWKIMYSLKLGAAVLKEMKRINRLHKQHVEQAGFAVLKGQGIPSILVETAFISNPTEERLLRSPSHQAKIARAIFNGVKKQVVADPTILKN